MNRTRALVLSLAVGLAAVAGLFALRPHVSRSASRHSLRATPDRPAHRAARPLRGVALDRPSHRSRRALPPLPDAGQAARSRRVAPTRVVYRRPPPWWSSHTARVTHEEEGAESDD